MNMTDKKHAPTLRDQFAMAALSELVAASNIYPGWRGSGTPLESRAYSSGVKSIAGTAYDIADAMLKEREE